MPNTDSRLKRVAAVGLFAAIGVVQSVIPPSIAHADCVGGFEQGGYAPTTCGPTQEYPTPTAQDGSALQACEQNQSPSGYANDGSNTLDQGIYNCPGSPAPVNGAPTP
jgi:hypothetical protein